MRGHTFCHCSRSMLARPATARAQVPKATASSANIVRPAAKSQARTAVSKTSSHFSGVAGSENKKALCGGAVDCQFAPSGSGCGMLPVMASSRRPLRLLHTADIHLDSDGCGNAAEQAAHRERERRIFRRIVECALTERVDLLLIAGDLFDHNRVPDETVEFARRELDRLRSPVVVLPGNHDCLRT